MLVGAINGLLNLVDIYSAGYGFRHFRFFTRIARQSDSSPATTPNSQGKSHLRDFMFSHSHADFTFILGDSSLRIHSYGLSDYLLTFTCYYLKL